MELLREAVDSISETEDMSSGITKIRWIFTLQIKQIYVKHLYFKDSGRIR